MGCYGIGVSRIVAAASEQNHDANGIVWPASIAPWQVVIVPMNMHRSETVKAAAEKMYADLQNAGIEVILDDRPERAGVMFADADLLGIPLRIVIGERGLKENQVEIKGRRDEQAHNVGLEAVLKTIHECLRH